MIERDDRPPFVGRQHELAVFHAHLQAARVGRGGVVFVAGEPGIGKTRLLREIGDLARTDGWQVLSGRAYDSEGTPPYLPFVEALRSYVLRCAPHELRAYLGASAQEVARVLPDVRRRLPDVPDSPTLGTEVDRYRLFEGFTDFLLAVAHVTPAHGLLLILDDLHWADRSSLLLLQHLAHRLAGARLLVAGSYRTVELNRSHPLAAVLADLRREGLSERLLLPPLPPDAIVVLVEALAGLRPAAGVLEMIAEQTDGNPFFVREMTLHLQAEGFLQRQLQRNLVAHTADSSATWSVPEGVREVIGRRLAKLGGPTNQMLEAAAVLGGGFSFAVLQRISGIEEAVLLDAIDQALGAGILREEGEGYVFEHALIRETVYSELSLARRQRLHLRAAETLDAVHGRAPAPYLGDIADHYRRAGPMADFAKAIDFALRAGEAAFSVLAYEQAAIHWRTALHLMEKHGIGVDERISLLEKLAGVTQWMGFVDHYSEARSYWEQCLRLCEAHARIDHAARVRCRIGILLASNTPSMDIVRGLAHLHAAEAILKERPDLESLGYLYGGLGSAAVWAARTPDGLSASQRGMDLGEQLADGSLWAYSAINHGWHLVSSGRLEHGFEVLERAWQTANHLDRTFEAYRATSFRGNRHFLLGDPEAAAACYETELAKARLAAAPSRRLALVSSLAAVRARTGNLVEARQLLSQLGAHTFDQDSAMLAQPLVAYWSGDWESARAAWDAARERHRRAGNRWGVADFACWLAQLQRVEGDPSGAVHTYEEALAIAVDAPIVPIELNTRAALAVLTAEQGSHQQSRAHLARCAQILAEGENWRGLAGRVVLAEAVEIAARGDAYGANAKFFEAIEVFRQYALPWDEAEALQIWGRSLGRAGLKVESGKKLNSAVDIYERCGAGTAWVERVNRDRPHRVGAHNYPDRLSEREVQVVRLIAAGKSNREIAQTLVISRNTVERHVNHILAKTGASNRTQVAGYAHRHELVD